MASKPRVKVPKKAKAGDVVRIKTLMRHKMENGLRKDKKTGQTIPRKIINNLTAKFDGATFFQARLAASISINPYIGFAARAEKSGEFEFTWTEDGGKTWTAKKKIAVS